MLDNRFKYFCFLNYQLLNDLTKEKDTRVTQYIEKYIDQTIMPFSLQIDKEENNYESPASYQS